jgi:hypothetical protein
MKSSPAFAHTDGTTVAALEARIAELTNVFSSRIDRLEAENIVLFDRGKAREAENISLAARLAAIESRVPAPRFEVPDGWLMAKQAAGACGYAASTLYRWVRQGKIVGGPYGGNVYIDPTSLPVKALSVSELTTEIK